MADWADKIAARRAGTVPGFVGQNTSLVAAPRHIDGVGLEGTSAQRAALDPSLYTGLYNETDTGQIWRSDGVAWSQFGTYAAAGSASSALANIYRTLTRATEDANVLVLGTSIEDETTEWPYLMTAAVAALFPAWTVKYQAATVDGSALINGYAAATTIQTGTNGRTLNVWNAAHTGYQALSILGQGGDTALACGGIDSADAVFISMGMNETATDVDARGRYTALLEKVMDRHPRAGIVSILQNPNNNNTNQAIVNRIISEIAASYSVPTVDVYDAFLNSGATWAADLLKVDGVHPNAAGSQVYLAEVMKAWTAAATARPDSGSRSRRPYGENLFTNPRFTKLDGSNVPIGWTASNATASKDTTNFETGTYAVRLVNGGSAAQSYVYFDLPLALCKGRWMTAIVRLRINGALAATVGRLSIEDGVTTVTQQASAAYGGGAFLNATISKLVDPAATRCRVKLYLDTGTGGTLGDITIDRATAFRGVGFHDSIDPEVDGKPDSLVFPTATVFTSGGTYTVPAGVAAVEVIAVGGGSGGGGGGTGNAAQVGGGGGGSGAQAHAVVTVTAGQVLTVAVGAGGAGGAGGAAGSNPGSNGSAGGDTTVTGTGVSVTGQGSNIGGKGALAGSTTLQPGGMYGQNFSQTTNAIAPGQGGSSGARGTSSFGYSGGSGAGGAAASGGNGGNGGAAGGAYAKGAASPSGTTGAVNAGNGSDAAANSGAGGGGGGGSQTGIGGTGGAGGSGFAIVRPVG